MATANETYFDAVTRHQVQIQRFSSGQARKVLELLEEADRDLVAKLNKRLARLPAGTDFTSRRWKALLKEMREARKEIMKKIAASSAEDLPGLAEVEAGAQLRMLDTALPFLHDFATVELGALEKAISTPFEGQTLEQWWKGLEETDIRRLNREIQIGYAQGESVPNLVKRIAGTQARGFRDGVLATTRRHAETIVRTAVNHTTNVAREAVFTENSDVISALRWSSVLDGRTTPICQANDGKLAPVGGKPVPANLAGPGMLLTPEAQRPPAHPSCRSQMTAVIDGEIVGERPYVRDTRTGKRRQLDFRKEARRTGRDVKDIRKEWIDKNVGRIPAKTTYNQWMKRQPAAFQNEVLGKTKAKLFRDGGLNLDKFVDRKGAELTLAQLADLEPDAFVKAGLNPAKF